jgi:hypothetical protein
MTRPDPHAPREVLTGLPGDWSRPVSREGTADHIGEAMTRAATDPDLAAIIRSYRRDEEEEEPMT